MVGMVTFDKTRRAYVRNKSNPPQIKKPPKTPYLSNQKIIDSGKVSLDDKNNLFVRHDVVDNYGNLDSTHDKINDGYRYMDNDKSKIKDTLFTRFKKLIWYG